MISKKRLEDIAHDTQHRIFDLTECTAIRKCIYDALVMAVDESGGQRQTTGRCPNGEHSSPLVDGHEVHKMWRSRLMTDTDQELVSLKARVLLLEDALAGCLVIFDSLDYPRLIQPESVQRWAGIGTVGLKKRKIEGDYDPR